MAVWYAISPPMSTRKKQKFSQNKPRAAKAPSGSYWMAGVHACMAALANPEREIQRIYCTRNMYQRLPESARGLAEQVEPDAIAQAAGEDMVHQGIAMLVKPLRGATVQDILALPEKRPVLALDQVTDPQNVGAMFRSAAAFGVGALLTTQDNAARESAALAKTACGGLDMVPWVQVVNLATALEELKQAGYWVAGMDGAAEQTIDSAKLGADTVLVMGAEGKGLRRLTQDTCDYMVKIAMDPRMESLNVSNATAIALHSLYTK